MKKHIMLFATMAALGAQVIFGFSFMFTKISLNYASPMTVIADRYLVAFLGMTLVMLITKQKIRLKKVRKISHFFSFSCEKIYE